MITDTRDNFVDRPVVGYMEECREKSVTRSINSLFRKWQAKGIYGDDVKGFITNWGVPSRPILPATIDGKHAAVNETREAYLDIDHLMPLIMHRVTILTLKNKLKPKHRVGFF